MKPIVVAAPVAACGAPACSPRTPVQEMMPALPVHLSITKCSELRGGPFGINRLLEREKAPGQFIPQFYAARAAV